MKTRTFVGPFALSHPNAADAESILFRLEENTLEVWVGQNGVWSQPIEYRNPPFDRPVTFLEVIQHGSWFHVWALEESGYVVDQGILDLRPQLSGLELKLWDLAHLLS